MADLLSEEKEDYNCLNLYIGDFAGASNVEVDAPEKINAHWIYLLRIYKGIDDDKW